VAWFDEFFDEHYLDYWAQILPPERTAREVRFIVEQIAPPEGGAVLDLCCGQARHAVELAKLGYRVTGLDLNEFLLDRAREAAAEAGVDLTLVQGDMREIPFDGQFDAVVNLFTAFGYFEDNAQNQRVLDGVARSLKPGGTFLLDQSNLLRAVCEYQPRVWHKYEDGTMLIENRIFDPHTLRFTTHATYIKPDGGRAERTNAIRCYTCPELRHMLEAAGLGIIAVFGDFDARELSHESKRLIVLSQRG